MPLFHTINTEQGHFHYRKAFNGLFFIPQCDINKSIGDHVFIYCPLQGELDFSAYGDLKMSTGVFWNCSSITAISFPADWTEIPDNICGGCDSLKTVTMGNKVQTIGEAAFCDCASIWKKNNNINL